MVQQTIAAYVRDKLGWESFYAWNDERFSPTGTAGGYPESLRLYELRRRWRVDQ
ncbi:MAG TPA: hypothetical protein VND64_20655 [Pirellulales bacterium]|nr:hypothetical protein [Pirellulales bacterium]